MLDFDYSQLPKHYVFCTQADCPRASQCLRHALMAGLPASLTYIRILSPVVSRGLAGRDCPHFSAADKKRFARGIEALLAQLQTFNYKDAVWLKRKIYNYFGKNSYYRTRHGERLITPRHQEQIRQFFLERGIDAEPVYDEYIYRYDTES